MSFTVQPLIEHLLRSLAEDPKMIWRRSLLSNSPRPSGEGWLVNTSLQYSRVHVIMEV